MKTDLERVQDWEQMKDRYNCTTTDEMVQTPLFLAEFADWAADMERDYALYGTADIDKAAESEMLEF